MGNFKKIFTVLFLFVLMGTLAFAGGPKRRVTFPGDSGDTLVAPYAPGEVLVKFKKGVTISSVNQIAGQNGMIVKKRFPTLSKLTGYEYALLKSSVANALDMVSVLKNNASVEAVSPNNRNEVDATPNDTYYAAYLWGMNNTSQTGGTAGADIDAELAWSISTGSANAIVAVIDTGLDRSHPDLAANVWVNAAEQAGTPGVDDDGNGYVDDIYGIDPAGTDGYTPDSDPMDGYGHGTHCAGTIGAVGNNSLGVVGVNWNVKIMGLKMFDDAGGNGYDDFAIEGIEYILFQKIYRAKNIVAVNASWGSYNYFDTILYDAVAALGDAGIVFCAAAGNDGNDNDDIDVHYPASYDLPNIIAVAATDADDLIADFSNYGATSVDLGAPGVGILSTVPGKYVPQSGDIFFDNMESGVGNWVTGGTNNSWAITTNIEKYYGSPYPTAPSPTHFWSDSPVNDSGYVYGRYLNNTDSYLAYNADIDLSGYVGNNVYFGISLGRHIGAGDHFYLEISADSGSSWTVLNDWPWTEGYIYYWASNVWTIPDAFKTAHFRMRCHLVTDASGTGIGVVIDDIGIGTHITYSYELWDGTSMAAPHVTGAVALMAAQFPSESLATRVARILDNVDPLASLAGLCVTGGRLNLFNAISAVAPVTTITVTSPNGGEQWTVGSVATITWNSTGTIPNVDIEYSIDSGSHWLPVATATVNDGSYAGTLPGPASTTCLVRISDSADNDPIDSSDALFTILAAGTEAVSAPEMPLGPSTGKAGSSYDFSTKGSVSSMGVGHLLQYKFNWDDGSDSSWLAADLIKTQASHVWASSGTYHVQAMARCATHTAIESPWSAIHAIVISESDRVSCDFNGDGKSDIAVWRPSNSNWYVMGQGDNQWGANSDQPVPGDYDGDWKTDIAVWRPSNGIWYVMGEGEYHGEYHWGMNGDIPVPADYNADGKDELAVFRPGDGTWYIYYRGTETYDAWKWGQAGDIPVVGDYDHDGYADLAVYRPSDGTWYIRKSSDWGLLSYKWGTGNDIPVPGDYNGDGQTDIAVWRPSNGYWYVMGQGEYFWGTNGDVPMCGDYNGDGKTDIAVWRPSNGYWYVKDQGAYQWGVSSDIPLD